MKSSKEQLKTGNFDKIAMWYEPLKKLVFGNSLMKAQMMNYHLLPELLFSEQQQIQVLIIGSGKAGQLKHLFQFLPAAQVTLFDCSDRMQNSVEKDLQGLWYQPQVEQVTGTFEELLLKPLKYQLVVADFFFDLYSNEDLSDRLNRLYALLPEKSLLLVTDFYALPLKTIFWRCNRWLISFMYLFFAVTTSLKTRHLPDIQPLVIEAGFTLINTGLRGPVFSALYSKQTVA